MRKVYHAKRIGPLHWGIYRNNILVGHASLVSPALFDLGGQMIDPERPLCDVTARDIVEMYGAANGDRIHPSLYELACELRIAAGGIVMIEYDHGEEAWRWCGQMARRQNVAVTDPPDMEDLDRQIKHILGAPPDAHWLDDAHEQVKALAKDPPTHIRLDTEAGLFVWGINVIEVWAAPHNLTTTDQVRQWAERELGAPIDRTPWDSDAIDAAAMVAEEYADDQ